MNTSVMNLDEQIRQFQKMAQPLYGLRLLVVDGNPDSRDLLSFALEAEGADVTASASVQEALEQIDCQPPDALLCEIILPTENGWSLIDKIRQLEIKHQKRIPAIAVTTQGAPHDQVRVMQAGFEYYLLKPINLDELIKTVAHLSAPPVDTPNHV